MKAYKSSIMAMTLALAIMLSGCAAASPVTSGSAAPSTSSAESSPEAPTDNNTSNPEKTVAEDKNSSQPASLNIDKDVFTDRDLDCEPDLSDAETIYAIDNSKYTITTAGTYVITGQASDFTIQVEADKNDDKVQIILKDLTVVNEDFPIVYVKSADKCFVTALGDNKLTVSKEFTSDGDINTDAVIFSKDDLTLNGTGSLTILSAAANGITCKDDLKVTGGKYNITSAKDAVEANDSISVYDGEFVIESNKDAFHCENDEKGGSIYIAGGVYTITAKDDGIQATTALVVDGGEFTITSAEGMEATTVQINDGKININASDDGINAARKSDEGDVVIEINGGEIKIVMGSGDTDGLDANGQIIVNGGTVDVTGQSTFDADNGSVYNGGTIIINGSVVDTIPQSTMGGHGQKGPNGGYNQGQMPGGKGNRPNQQKVQ